MLYIVIKKRIEEILLVELYVILIFFDVFFIYSKSSTMTMHHLSEK